MKKLSIMFVLLCAFFAQFAQAGETRPLQLALFNPVQMVPETESIMGVRLSAFYSVNEDVSGLDIVWLGANRTTRDFSGVGLGLANWVEGGAYGLQIGAVNHAGARCVGMQYGFANVVEGDFTGLQWGLVNWTEGFMHGGQYGVVNVSKGEAVGLDLGIINWSEGSYRGVQGGLVNYAGEMHGLQIGIVNYTKSLDGLQIGLGNYNGNKKPMEFMVLANWSF